MSKKRIFDIEEMEPGHDERRGPSFDEPESLSSRLGLTARLREIANQDSGTVVTSATPNVVTTPPYYHPRPRPSASEPKEKMPSYQATEFVSPITGSLTNDLITVLIAHGVYQSPRTTLKPVDGEQVVMQPKPAPSAFVEQFNDDEYVDEYGKIVLDDLPSEPVSFDDFDDSSHISELDVRELGGLNVSQLSGLNEGNLKIHAKGVFQGRLFIPSLDDDGLHDSQGSSISSSSTGAVVIYDRQLCEVMAETDPERLQGEKPTIVEKSVTPVDAVLAKKPLAADELIDPLNQKLTETVRQVGSVANRTETPVQFFGMSKFPSMVGQSMPNNEYSDEEEETWAYSEAEPTAILSDKLEKYDQVRQGNFSTGQVPSKGNLCYEVPSLDLLEGSDEPAESDDQWIFNKMYILENTFASFGVKVRLTGAFITGPTVTQIEVAPELGTKMSRILGLQNDLMLSLSVSDLRIEPIAGRNTIGIEIPNLRRCVVRLKDVLSQPEFLLHESPLYIGLGEDIAGKSVYTDILTMPHGLIAGQTGSGKSVCINTLLISILYKATPSDVRLMLIDPKRVELAPYDGLPHLVTPVITDEKKAATALKWAVDEMERRYDLFAKNGVREIKAFNSKRTEFEFEYEKLPYILIIVDELADLMMTSAAEVESDIMRLTQKARAAGIHLIVATQRPTVDVITGTIKSNIPTRIAFAVAQANDSRVILDGNGAEMLLGYGDMLIAESGSKSKRVQGSYVSSEEIDRVVAAVRKQQSVPNYLIEDDALDARMAKNQQQAAIDPLTREAMELFLTKGGASISSLQTKFRIGYNRAARIIDDLESAGLISAPNLSTKRREVLVNEAALDEIFGKK